MIIIDINSLSPMNAKGAGLDHQQWQAWIDGELVYTGREPFFPTARILQSRGVPDDTPIALRHRGAGHVSLTSTVGQAAKLTVTDDNRGRPRFKKFQPYPEDIRHLE